MKTEDMLTIQEAADLITEKTGVSTSYHTVHKRIQRGQLATVKIFGRVYVRKAVLLDFINANIQDDGQD